MTAKKNEIKNDNNIIWDKVIHTDPKYTKPFKKAGGFSGTSINAQYNVQRATDAFGPNGKGWGVNVLSEDFREGHPLTIENGVVLCRSVIHIMKVSVWYTLDGEKYETSPQFGQTTFIGSNKYGIFTDEEAPKKTMTDAMNKCLAILGFGADIFLGMYDDNEYINDMKEQFKQDEQPKKKEKLKGPLQRTALRAQLRLYLTGVLKSTSMEEFKQQAIDYKTAIDQATEQCPEFFDEQNEEDFPTFREQIKKKKDAIKREEAIEKQQREDMEPPQ